MSTINRRNLLTGLAAASAAAAVSDASAYESENPELLRLARELPHLEKEYIHASAARKAIYAEWAPKWPDAPEAILNGWGIWGDIERGLDDRGIQRTNHYGESRCQAIITAKYARNRVEEYQKSVSRQRIEKSIVRAKEDVAYWREILDVAEIYEAECARIKEQSGFTAAHKREKKARDTLRSAVSAIIAETDRTMTGVMVKAQALASWQNVEFSYRMINSEGINWGADLAASIMRHAQLHGA